jgi:hypothetical protein
MKKKLLFGFLILFVLSTTAFAGLSDPKKENEKPAISRENKLSEEELSRMNRRAEIDNLSGSNLLNKEKSSSKDLKASKQIYVEGGHRHGGYYMYGGGLLLVIILVIILV